MSQRDLSTHLSDTEFTDLLLGSIPPTVTGHLEICTLCAREAQRVSGAIVNFERKAAPGPDSAPPHSRPPWRGPVRAGSRSRDLAWHWQATGVLALLCLGLSVGYQVQHRVTSPASMAAVSSSRTASPQVAPATLKADNELLSAIDGELQADATPPASIYGLELPDSQSQSRKGRKVTN